MKKFTKSYWKQIEKISSLYTNIHNNAIDLLVDSQLLFENRRFSRAFFLTVCAIEELGKSQIIADYINEDVSENEYNKAFKSHEFKLAYQYRWMEITGNSKANLKWDIKEGEKLQKLKEQSIYTQKQLQQDNYWKTHAEEMINFVQEWLDDILHAEWLNQRIGSKSIWK